jgi:hypothetical protein
LAPPFVRTVDEYWAWLDRTIRRSGGALVDSDELVVQPILRDDSDEFAGLRVPSQEIEFANGMRLRMTIVVNEDLEEIDYSFDYRGAGKELVWRKDRHRGHEDSGGLEHIHRGPRGDERPAWYESVDLSEVIQQIWSHQETGRRE